MKSGDSMAESDRKILYLDESGDHSLDKIDSSYPVFVLGGIVVDHSFGTNDIPERVISFKRRLFGSDEIILRTADIRRNRNGFESLKDPEFRDIFYRELNQLMSELEYEIIACAILKDKHLDRYGMSALDPYMLALNVVAERFYFDVARIGGKGQIIAERRNPILDQQLELAWLSLKISGTRFVQGSQFSRDLTGLTLRHKRDNVAGLQLADLVISTIGRYVLNKETHEDWDIIESKFRRHNGNWRGAGLITLPKEQGQDPLRSSQPICRDYTRIN